MASTGTLLHPGRHLVYTQMNPMHAMSHVMSHNPRDFPLLPIRRMRLQDGSLGAQKDDRDLQNRYHVYLKIRALWLSFAFVCIDIQDYFSLEHAEAVSDKMLAFIFAYHSGGAPPVTFFTEAWDSTARVFQVGVRAGKPLGTLTESDSLWQHFWTAWTQSRAKQTPRTSESYSRSSSKGGAKGEVEAMQQKKDKTIADLKRKLESAQKGQQSWGSRGNDSSWKGGWKKHRNH